MNEMRPNPNEKNFESTNEYIVEKCLKELIVNNCYIPPSFFHDSIIKITKSSILWLEQFYVR